MSAGGGEGGGIDMDAMGNLLQMINDLGDKLKEDCSLKYVPIPHFEDHVGKNSDEHKIFENDSNRAALRLKLLEDWRGIKDERDAKTDKDLGLMEKHVKKHTD